MKRDYLKRLGFTIEADKCIMCSIFRLSVTNLNNSTMSNLSKETRERIEADALRYAEQQYGHDDVNKDYLEGALHEAGRAQGLAEAIFTIYGKDGPGKQSTINAVNKALISFYGSQEGVDAALAKYKEVENG